MENAVKVAAVMGPVMVVLGLSILIYVKSWQKLFDGWLKNHYQMITLLMFMLVVGIISVRMYNVWTLDVWLLVTLGGWSLILKSAAALLLPGAVTKWSLSMAKNTPLMILGALIILAWGGVLSYYTYFAA
jgi:hypothetical protein